jgi:hypothetical protein
MTDTLAPLSTAILYRHLSPAQAAQWLNSRVHPLVIERKLHPVEALDLVLADVKAENPATLASPGQIWELRDGHGTPTAPQLLFIRGRRDAAWAQVQTAAAPEREYELPVSALAAYRLVRWFWEEA